MSTVRKCFHCQHVQQKILSALIFSLKQKIPQSDRNWGLRGKVSVLSLCRRWYNVQSMTGEIISWKSLKSFQKSYQGLGFLRRRRHFTSSKGERRHGRLSGTGLSPAGWMSALTSVSPHLSLQQLSRGALQRPLKSTLFLRREKKW